MVKDYCGNSIGFRVDEKTKTIQVIWKFDGKWRTCGEPLTYPIPSDLFPQAPPVSNVNLWELAWAILKTDNFPKAEELKSAVASPH